MMPSYLVRLFDLFDFAQLCFCFARWGLGTELYLFTSAMYLR